MRRQIGALALATAALLTVTAASAAAAAAASVPASMPAEDPIVPAGDGNPTRDDGATSQADSAMTRAEREAALARGGRQAADLMGFLPSLYQGKWFKPGHEGVRRCIVLRESHANYRATSGTYHGAYQMSEALADGAAWMMQAEVRKEMGAEGVKIVEALRRTSPNNWNRYWQDRAFWTIWRNGAGASHWAGGAHRC